VTGPAPGLRPSAAGVVLDVRVIPRSSRAGVGGVRDGRLVVRVTAAPVDDAANDAVVRALAEALEVPRRAVRITAGATSKNKAIEISGVDAATIQQRIAGLS
jgi:uncharacterized protein (TIGR00251 family)